MRPERWWRGKPGDAAEVGRSESTLPSEESDLMMGGVPCYAGLPSGACGTVPPYHDQKHSGPAGKK